MPRRDRKMPRRIKLPIVSEDEEDGDSVFTTKVSGPPETSAGGRNGDVKPADQAPQRSSKSVIVLSRAPQAALGEAVTLVKPAIPFVGAEKRGEQKDRGNGAALPAPVGAHGLQSAAVCPPEPDDEFVFTKKISMARPKILKSTLARTKILNAPPAVLALHAEKRWRTGDGTDKPADQKERRKSVWHSEQDGDYVFTKKVTGQPKNVKATDKEPWQSSKSSAVASKAPEISAAEPAEPVKPTISRIKETIDISDFSVSSFVATLPAQTRDAVMPIPVRDTPAIDRNKEMRNKNPNGPRRSSLGSRGRRCSTTLHGLCHIPHPDVSSSDFYRHIQDDLSEPQKMKQLLAWCAERAMSAPPRRNRKDALAADLSQIRTELQNDFIEAIRSGKVNCSWVFRRNEPHEGQPPVIKPNPKNVLNEKCLVKVEQTLSRLQKEAENWMELLKEKTSHHAAVVDTVPCLSVTRTVDPVTAQAMLVEQLDEEQRRLLERDSWRICNGLNEAVRSCNDLLERLVPFNGAITKQDLLPEGLAVAGASAQMSKHARDGNGESEGQVDDGIAGDLALPSRTVSLRCLLSGERLSKPARGSNCAHRDCLELDGMAPFEQDLAREPR
ncbi:Mis12-Mtw1 protein family-domain-containing protein [Hyaloraphidium curvatum]|nr:Mis12-Mtw1 protein family-domain-containing protein [Hyaloraphidium curvatum]